ncbi:hypothetical protein Mapa_009509 [Marchantia paleacea]|nr:hypothetical protein Mapa_009509 [Marchantia paleacea]
MTERAMSNGHCPIQSFVFNTLVPCRNSMHRRLDNAAILLCTKTAAKFIRNPRVSLSQTVKIIIS